MTLMPPLAFWSTASSLGFLHETFKVAAFDDDLMVVQKKRATAKYKEKIKKFFEMADSSGDGLLSKAEFKEILSDSSVAVWFSAMDVEVGDCDMLFDFIDDGSQEVTIDVLTDGIARLKGGARSIDVVALMFKLV